MKTSNIKFSDEGANSLYLWFPLHTWNSHDRNTAFLKFTRDDTKLEESQGDQDFPWLDFLSIPVILVPADMDYIWFMHQRKKKSVNLKWHLGALDLCNQVWMHVWTVVNISFFDSDPLALG